MNVFRLSLLSLVGIALFTTLLSSTGRTQEATSQDANSSDALNRLSTAFSGGHIVQSVQLSGNAVWHAGGEEDSGSVNLSASVDGSSQVELILDRAGKRIETQTGAGANALCQWAGTDGVAHNASANNCLRPHLWFLPALWLQPALPANNLKTNDLGSGTVGSGAVVYRHLRSQFLLSGQQDPITDDITQQSTTDLGLDTTSLLPAVLTYSVRPDSGAAIPVKIEIRYADYRVVDGAQIPFRIERYVNGALQLDIFVTDAQVR